MNISFRNLTNKDFDKLYIWCQNKFVYEWFEQRILSLEEIKTKYSNKLKLGKQELFIIQYNNIDIGLVQIYKYDDELDLNILKRFNNKYEYDLFIGIDEYLNKGIGTEIINLIDKMIYDKGADSIILRPFKRNIRAIKCYEKCGYRIINEYEGKDTLGNKEIITVLLNEKSTNN